MLFPGRRLLPYRFQLLLASLQLSDSLPFADVLRQEQIEEVSDRHQVSFGNEEQVVLTPAITLLAFLSQVIHKGEQRSCLAAVARIGVLLVDGDTLRVFAQSVVVALGDQRVGYRCGRVEPRAVKHRPKPTPLLTMPRCQAQQLLLARTHLYQKQK